MAKRPPVKIAPRRHKAFRLTAEAWARLQWLAENPTPRLLRLAKHRCRKIGTFNFDPATGKMSHGLVLELALMGISIPRVRHREVVALRRAYETRNGAMMRAQEHRRRTRDDPAHFEPVLPRAPVNLVPINPLAVTAPVKDDDDAD